MIHIAIDGPSAGGKGTVTKILSKKLGIPCLDTGAIYRGIGIAENRGTPIEQINITAKIIGDETHIYLDGKDITDQLRKNEVSKMASRVGTMPLARALATRVSQDIAKNQSIIAEGRDICSVVIPNAKYKFFLTAKPKIRAQRRYDELIARDPNCGITYKQVLLETRARDRQDAKKGGLLRTKDAIIIDSSKLSIDQVAENILNYIHER